MIVVDTHILLWNALAPAQLSTAAVDAIRAADQTDGIVVADISLWEIAMLIQKERILVDTDCRSFLNLLLNANQIHVHQITPEIASLASQASSTLNADPADRLIVATALAANLALVTADGNLRKSPEIITIW